MSTRRVGFPIKLYPSAEAARIVGGGVLPPLYARRASVA
jgi:hypothetical protein